MAERPYSKDDFDRGNEVAGITRGGGFGRNTRIRDTRPRAADMVDTPPIKPRGVDDAFRAVEKSVEDRGGFPTLNGQPRMTKMQQRAIDRERMKYAK